MKLKNLIGKQVIRTNPRNLPGSSEGFWDFSFMTYPIEIIDVGRNHIFYKNIYPKNSWIEKKFGYDYVNKIEKIDICSDDGKWVEYLESDKEKHLENERQWQEYYEKKYPEQIRIMQENW